MNGHSRCKDLRRRCIKGNRTMKTKDTSKERTMKMDYDFDHRPITIVGAGTLGRRMALVLSTRGSEVRIFDKNQKAGDDAVKYIAERLPRVLSRVPGGTPAKVVAADDLSKAVADA